MQKNFCPGTYLTHQLARVVNALPSTAQVLATSPEAWGTFFQVGDALMAAEADRPQA